MATNLYFNNYNSSPEQRLIEDLMIETIKINGVDCYYIPNVNEAARDLIYGEDPLKRFTAAYPLELYITNVDGYEGEREFFSKFGLEIRNNMSVIVSKRSFARWVPQDRYLRPREGDLIYIPFLSQTGEMYEIKYVNYSEAFYVLGNKYPYFYKLELEKFKYSQETIDVGIPNVDVMDAQDAYAITLNMAKPNVTMDSTYYFFDSSLLTMDNNNPTQASSLLNYIVDERVITTSGSGTVISWDAPSKKLKVIDILGSFSEGQFVTGETSGAMLVIGAPVEPLTDPQEREQYDNLLIQAEADSITDFSESNPFGTPT